MVLLFLFLWSSPSLALPILASAPGLGTRNFVHLTVSPFDDDPELMSPGKLRELEHQLKVLNNELLAKVGPEAGGSQGGLFPRVELPVLMASHSLGMVPMTEQRADACRMWAGES